ncbi:hypothetical protein P7C73_g2742, partial [Tremellales sp. Uapishka_1]
MGQVSSSFTDAGVRGRHTVRLSNALVPVSLPALLHDDARRARDIPLRSSRQAECMNPTPSANLAHLPAIWKFTFYWTLILLGSLFLLCSLLASLSLLLSLTIYNPKPSSGAPAPPDEPIFAEPQTPQTHSTSPLIPPRKRPKRKRPPLWPVFLLPVVMTSIACFVALITGTVVGFTLAAVYSAGGFSMSTWVPLLWALVLCLILITSSYSTLTAIL